MLVVSDMDGAGLDGLGSVCHDHISSPKKYT